MSCNPKNFQTHSSVPIDVEAVPLLPLLALPVGATGATEGKKKKSRGLSTAFAKDAQKVQGQTDPNPLEWRTGKVLYRDCRLCGIRSCFLAGESDDIFIALWIAFKSTGAALVNLFRGILKTFETLVTYLSCFKELGEAFVALLRWLLSLLIAIWGVFVCIIQPILFVCQRVSDFCTRRGAKGRSDNLKTQSSKAAATKGKDPQKPATAV